MTHRCPSALRDEFIEIGVRMHQAGLVAASDGNLSVRADDDTIWITPTGAALGDLDRSNSNHQIVGMDLSGRVLTAGTPSSEYALHLEVYAQRPKVRAIVHAHPPLASAFMFAGKAAILEKPVIPEVVAGFGSIVMAPYATPSSAEGPAAIRALIRNHDVLLLERHGSLTVSERHLLDAFYKLEKLEQAARIAALSLQLGAWIELSDDECARLHAVVAALKKSGA